MNKITKKSFYSFLSLYTISSFIFLAIAAYWFFTSQVSMEMNNNFYRMTHIADRVSSEVIKAQMNGTKYKLQHFDNASVALMDKDKKLLDGSVSKKIDFSKEFYNDEGGFTLVSQRAAGHLNVQYIVVQSSECNQNIDVLKNKIAYTVIITAIFIIIIAVFLSYIFLKPLRDKMQEIEEFVKDATHELNTPITALMMSTSRLKMKKEYDENCLNNISISTKQLYDIYSSLSYLSFDNKSEESQMVALDEVIKDDIRYLSELLDKKNICVVQNLNKCMLKIAPTKAKMLINNLLSNSIKYSTPNTTIAITTTKETLIVQDAGIGIEKEKLDEIFKRFVRANSYAGGFGVGLSVVESIIKEYKYKIHIESAVGSGTTVTINFNEQKS